MTPETQIPATAPDGFVTYDEFRGPDLDAARWAPARLPLPTGGEHLPLDPNAGLAVGEGEVRVMIPRFSLSHDAIQSVDSVKYLTLSTGEFELSPDRPRRSPPSSRSTTSAGSRGTSVEGSQPFQASR